MGERGNVDEILERLREFAANLYPEVVVDVEIVYGKLRIYLIDESFIDVWISRRLPNRYAIHWKRRHIDGTIYRWDNTPHEINRHIPTFPHHFHEGNDRVVNLSITLKVLKTRLRRL
ncbi:hypothetical protein Hbut_1622 [Hyperthermus butylicus DSM 5456]|uniref:Uncharacterized protein n=1 Tax=Hyperthermus butylicus (strain DSM 5456 / JCM 9403 / PLM1-5) TaxID=415426 RepID=A2BN76_HYPBU|nr:hypothetical protein Hbut_1622 [Hyperthermus butylicus DSM 5456]